jgi:hypothetical protein
MQMTGWHRRPSFSHDLISFLPFCKPSVTSYAHHAVDDLAPKAISFNVPTTTTTGSGNPQKKSFDLRPTYNGGMTGPMAGLPRAMSLARGGAGGGGNDVYMVTQVRQA